MNYKLITNVVIEDIFKWDMPDFCDAFISSADYNGKPMTDAELDDLKMSLYTSKF